MVHTYNSYLCFKRVGYNIRIISRRNRHRAGTTWYTHITVIFVLNGLDTTSESSLAETGIEQVQHGTHIYNSYLCFKRVGYNIRIISHRNRHRAGTTWYTHITVIFVLNGLDTTSESSLAETGIEQVQHGTHIYNSYLCFKRVGYNIRIISRRNRHRAGTTWYTHITVIFVLNGLDTTSESSLAETGIEQVQHGTHI